MRMAYLCQDTTQVASSSAWNCKVILGKISNKSIYVTAVAGVGFLVEALRHGNALSPQSMIVLTPPHPGFDAIIKELN